MPSRFAPIPPRNIQTPQQAADYTRQNLQNVAAALSAPIVHDWGTLSADQTLDIQIADANVLTLAASVDLTLKTDAVPDRTLVRLFIKQDGTGSRIVTSWTGVTWLTGFTPILRTAASALDLLEFTYVQSLATWIGRYLTGARVDTGDVYARGNVSIENGKYYRAQRADGADIIVLGFDSGTNTLRTMLPGTWSVRDTGGGLLLSLTTLGILTLPAYGAGGGAVSVGAADSGGVGFRVLRVPN